MAGMDLPLMAALTEPAAERVKGECESKESNEAGTLGLPLETKQGEASHMGERLARVYAKLDQSAENQLDRWTSCGG